MRPRINQQYATYSAYSDANEPFEGLANYSSQPSNYAYAGFYDTEPVWSGYTMSVGANGLDPCRPFYENYLYANFIFTLNDVNPTGLYGESVALTNRVGEVSSLYFGNPTGDPNYLVLTNSPPSLFRQPTTQGVTIAPQINDAQLLYAYQFDFVRNDYTNGIYYDMEGAGLTYVANPDQTTTITMENAPVNYFGIPIQSAEAVYYDENDILQIQSELPGTSFTVKAPCFAFPQTAQPEFQTVQYDFWNVSSNALPGDSNFSLTNTVRQPLIVAVGNPASIAGYAKLAVTNGNPGLYGYLGQYFTNAYEIDSGGSVTTNTTGVLSPYGQFFATEPGQAALVTMPDPDTGQQGTGVVDVISLNVDANHDGTMDLTFTGPDFVCPNNPYRFWINDNQDSGDDSGNGGISTPDDPRADGICPSAVDDDGNPLYKIHGTRDLVDFFPVYVNIGSLFPSNALSAGISYADTNWQFILSQYDGALRFAYTDLTPTNYMNYLRDQATISNLLDNPYTYPFLTTVSNSGVALSSSFIADIATNNGGIILVEAWEPTTKPLVLTIYHGTNQIAQTSLYLSISEVEQMFRHKNIMLQPEPGLAHLTFRQRGGYLTRQAIFGAPWNMQ